MYNELLNWSPYNSTTYPSIDSITDSIIFNGFGLQNDKIKVSFKDDQNLPKIDLSDFSNTVVDGGGIINRKYSEKIISFRGTIKGVNNTELLQLIDLFKLKTSAVEWYLDIKYGNSYRRTKATVILSDVFPMEHYNIDWTNFKISFKTVDPFFYDINSEVNTEVNITGNTYIEFTYNWTATSKLLSYMVFWTTVGTDEIKISLWDRSITINETIPSNAIVVIDWVNKLVKVNNVEVDYVWRFPEITNWSNLIYIEVNGTMTYDLTTLYKNNYL